MARAVHGVAEGIQKRPGVSGSGEECDWAEPAFLVGFSENTGDESKSGLRRRYQCRGRGVGCLAHAHAVCGAVHGVYEGTLEVA